MNNTFNPLEQLFNIVTVLRQEFAGVQLISGNTQFIIRFRSIAFTFVVTDDKLVLCSRNWNCGSHWQQELLDRTYGTEEQAQGLLAQLRSELWFEQEILEVA